MLVSTLVVALLIAWSSWKKKTTRARSLMVFALGLAVWAVAEIIYSNESSPYFILAVNLSSLSTSLTAMALFIFAVEFTNVGKITWRELLLLLIEPLLTQFLLSAMPFGEFFPDIRVLGPAALWASSGSWLWVHIVYVTIIILVALVVLAQALFNGTVAYRRLLRMLVIGVFFPLMANIAEMMGFFPLKSASLTFVAFLFLGTVLLISIFFHRLLDIVLISRNRIIDDMEDGWVVLDRENRIVDLNAAAESIIGIPRNKIFDQPVEKVLTDWPNLVRRVGSERDLDMRGSVTIQGERRYLDLRFSTLRDRSRAQLGQLISWHDITERRKVEDARQRARDEMFSLLYSISGAASRAESLSDFITASIYQLAYSFHSQVGVVFLVDESMEPKEGIRLLLAAHIGLEASMVADMGGISADDELVSWVIEHRETLIVEDIAGDQRLPSKLREALQGSLLFVPMISDDSLVGIIVMVRVQGNYSNDEIARLTVAAERVATYIQSDKRRELAIALSERRRLVRDLHDSVTQKLYGLITLTEAAQAGVEAGATELPVQSLTKIGENARQALKEMRLFLHQLQPIDLEREGLAAVLYKRLEAVEGRADMKARLLCDEEIALSLEKEVAMYFIAQEALNNVLKHAAARSVIVTLKQGRSNVRLEIVDDGRGFNPKTIGKGGMGLRNMRERARQVGGKFSLVSNPGKGTKIIITVKKDFSLKSHQKRR